MADANVKTAYNFNMSGFLIPAHHRKIFSIALALSEDFFL